MNTDTKEDAPMSGRPGFFDAMGWLQDFADCLAGEGEVGADEAEEWMERNADLPTDGTSWQRWRDFRLAEEAAR